MAAFQSFSSSLSARRSGATGSAATYAGEFVSGNYFSMFGIGAFAGRAITPADDQPNAGPVAMMSFATALEEVFGSNYSSIAI